MATRVPTPYKGRGRTTGAILRRGSRSYPPVRVQLRGELGGMDPLPARRAPRRLSRLPPRVNESGRIPARDAFGSGESGDPVVLTRRGPGRNDAVLLPVEATAVWQRHLAQQEAEREQRHPDGCWWPWPASRSGTASRVGVTFVDSAPWWEADTPPSPVA